MTSTKPVRLALVTDSHGCTSWWRSPLASLSSQGHVRVTAVWAETETDANALNCDLVAGTARTYWGWQSGLAHAKKKGKLATKNLQSFENLGCAENDVDALLIDLPASKHIRAIEILFSIKNFNKHIFSCGVPIQDSSVFDKLIKQHIQIQRKIVNPHGANFPILWTIEDSMIYEASVTSMVELLKDIGTVLGGSVSGSQLPFMGLDQNDEKAKMSQLSTAYISLMRYIFGDIEVLNCIESDKQKQLIGWAGFENKVLCTFDISTASSSTLEVWVWGTLGRLSLKWDNLKHFQRYLKHFEHPLLHYPIGHSWCLTAWVEAIQNKTALPLKNATSPFRSLIHLSILEAMKNSNGVLVAFKPVPIPIQIPIC